jgi:hypothetical protein
MKSQLPVHQDASRRRSPSQLANDQTSFPDDNPSSTMYELLAAIDPEHTQGNS